jgi:hypothetical protein
MSDVAVGDQVKYLDGKSGSVETIDKDGNAKVKWDTGGRGVVLARHCAKLADDENGEDEKKTKRAKR